MRRAGVVVVGLVAVVGVLGCSGGGSKSKSKSKSESESEIKAKAKAKVETKTKTRIEAGGLGEGGGQGYVGVVAARDSAVVAAEIGGRLVRLEVRMGERVQKGQVIAVIDDSQLRKELAAAKAALTGAYLDVGQARHRHRVARNLYRSGVGPAEDMRSARVTIGKAAATAAQKAQQVRQLQQKLAKSG